MATIYSPRIITDGLITYWDAGNPKSFISGGTTWFDLGSNKYDGVLTNDPTYDSNNGGSIVFNGTDNAIIISTTALLSVNEMTISCWNYSSDYNHNGFMFEKTTNGLLNTQYNLFFNSTNDIFYRTQGLSTTDLVIDITTAGVVNSQWNNIVATWDGINKRIYVNGILVITSANLTGTVTQNTTGLASIGMYGNAQGYPFNGKVSQTSVYSRELTTNEIIQNYNALKNRFQ